MAFQTLPGIQVNWNDVVLGGSDSFVQWNVKRRPSGTVSYTRIATIPTRSTRSYIDYNVASAQNYDYAISVTALRTAVQIESGLGTISDSVTFAANFLHQVGAAYTYVE